MTLGTATLSPTINDLQKPQEVVYQAKRTQPGGHQSVYKRVMPDGELIELSPKPSQELYNHSPDGFQWGYGGSGPAQLALALLLDATNNPETALAFYQRFKWSMVATWGTSWSITKGSILLWLERQRGSQP